MLNPGGFRPEVVFFLVPGGQGGGGSVWGQGCKMSRWRVDARKGSNSGQSSRSTLNSGGKTLCNDVSCSMRIFARIAQLKNK